MVILTRLLYAYDEVVINLMFALLERKDFHKVIFWSSELFYSGFLRELSELVWKIYYDFYALCSNIPLYKLKGKYAKFQKTNNFESLLAFLYILFQSEPSCDIFIITHLVKIKKVAKINNIESIFNIIESLLENKKFYHIINYLKSAITQKEKETIKQYNILMQNKLMQNKLMQNKLFKKNKNSSDIFSQLMSHFFSSFSVQKKRRYKTLSEESIQYFKDLKMDVHSMKMFQEKRIYEIDDDTGIFKLERQNETMSEIFWYHWEFHSRNTPYWNEKYEKDNVKWDGKTIIFPNDDKLEEFYDNYDYELDELPFAVSNKSIKKLNENGTILDFLYKYFKIINIPIIKNKIDIKSKIKFYTKNA